MKKYFGMAMIAGLAGCTQQPAPVMSGYTGKMEATPAPHYTLKAARAGEPSVVETRTATPAATTAYNYGSAAPTMKEESLALIEPAGGPLDDTQTVQPVQRSQPTGSGAGGSTYTFQDRDTLYSVARDHGTTARKLIEANGLASAADVAPGQVLVIPAHDGNRPSSLDAVARAERATSGVQEEVARKEQAMQLIEPAAGEVPSTGLSNQTTSGQVLQQGDLQTYSATGGTATSQNAVRYTEHLVAAGETVYRISVNYKASVFDIMAANDFTTPQDLKAGTLVRIPLPQTPESVQTAGVQTQVSEQVATQSTVEDTTNGAEAQVTTVEKTTTIVQTPEGTIGTGDKAALEKVVTTTRTETKSASAADSVDAIMLVQKGRIDPVASKAKGLAWPVKGRIIRKYGEAAEGVNHTGINIAVPTNTPVVAADMGTVLYADSGLKTYGQLVLIRHADGMVTAYAHNNKLLVSKGEKVKKGQVISLSGSSGNVDEPQVHFEIRKEARAIDPLRVLASR